ncbi:hypothetical protein QQ045_019113 [Rhodiola kirilowii]
MSEVPVDATDEVVQRYARAYILLWDWEHLIIGRSRKLVVPSPPTGSDIDPMRLPALGYKWSVPKSWMQTSHHVLMLYRDLLDLQESNDVIWTPYNDEVLATHNRMCVAGRESWRAEVHSSVSISLSGITHLKFSTSLDGDNLSHRCHHKLTKICT